MAQQIRTTRTPRFSVVSAVYGVEKYLGDFIASIEAQDFPLDQLEVIMVDDGSEDSSPRLLAEWRERRPDLVTIVTQANAGLPAARNAGLPYVTGEWVTFIDPDDMVGPAYFSEVDAMLRRHPHVHMAATRRTVLDDATGEAKPHTLDLHFDKTNRVRDLDMHPEFFVGHAPSTFVRTEELRRTGLRFGELVRPNWEDGHFCVNYLLGLDRPEVAFVSTAEYFYRRRSDNTSVLSVSRLHPGRYTDVLEYGYLDVLERARATCGRVPGWLQTYILYELSWYFATEDRFTRVPSVVVGDTAERMHKLMTRITGLLDESVIMSFQVRPFRRQWRDVLLHAYADVPWHQDFAVVDRFDTTQKLVRVSYLYVGPPPQEEFFIEGATVAPAYAKRRGVPYFGRPMLTERIVWLPSGGTRVRLDGVDVEVRLEEPELPRYTLRLWNIRDHLAPDHPDATPRPDPRTLTR